MKPATVFDVLLIAIIGLVIMFVLDGVDKRTQRIERDLHTLICTPGESSIVPITITNGRVAGKTTASLTGCRP